MVKLRWSPQAASDLESLCEYIAKDSLEYARLLAATIVATIESIPDFPMAGRSVPEYRDERVRQRIVGNYRIIYRWLKEEDTVEVVSIVHGARLLHKD